MTAQSLISDFYTRGDEICVLVRIHQTKGSTPRELGAMMLVSQCALHGSIGGGRLEQEAIQIARNQIDLLGGNSHDRVVVQNPYLQTFSLGASLGQCCGGKVELSFETLLPGCSLPTVLQQLDNHFTSTMPPIVLFGAGHVGRALVNIMATLPCQLTWVDSRANEFARYTNPLPQHIHAVLTDPTESGLAEVAEVADAPPGAAYVVMTHSHALDLEICAAILRRKDFAYVGLIGSRTKATRFQQRLKERQISNACQLVCPIGVLGISGKEPAVVALSIASALAQLKAVDPTDRVQQRAHISPSQHTHTTLPETI
jgi:xanthine dehydrogenase accessory factor